VKLYHVNPNPTTSQVLVTVGKTVPEVMIKAQPCIAPALADRTRQARSWSQSELNYVERLLVENHWVEGPLLSRIEACCDVSAL
jgi:hypothetical protein